MQRTKLAGITPTQADILKRLHFFQAKQPKVHSKGLKPSDVGAFPNTAHYDSLRRLVDQGLVSRTLEEGGGRHVYRITEAGVNKWALLQLLAGTPHQTVIGPEGSCNKLRPFASLCGV
jgi:hypothetical protein